MNGIGERISQIIQVAGIKRVDFARRLGIDASYVTHLTKGKNPPSEALVKLICREFQVREEWLLSGKGPMTDAEPRTPLSEYVRERGLTPFEEKLVRAWIDLPQEIRRMLLEHFQQRLSDGGDLLDGLELSASGSGVEPKNSQNGCKPETLEEWAEREAQAYKQRLLAGEEPITQRTRRRLTPEETARAVAKMEAGEELTPDEQAELVFQAATREKKRASTA